MRAAGAVQEPAQVAPRRAVLELQPHLRDLKSGARGVDRHRRLHPEAARERQQAPHGRASHRALAGDRRLQVEPGEATGSPSARIRRRGRSLRRASSRTPPRRDRSGPPPRVAPAAPGRSPTRPGPRRTGGTSAPRCPARRARAAPPRWRSRPCPHGSPPASAPRRHAPPRAAVSSVEPPSTTITRGCSNASVRARTVSAIRSASSRAMTRTTGEPAGSGDTAGYSAANLARGRSRP